jgi:hypothetical protein
MYGIEICQGLPSNLVQRKLKNVSNQSFPNMQM